MVNISESYIGEVFADEPQAALEEGEDFDPHISLTISGTTKCPEDKENEYCAYGSNLATVGKTTYSDVYGIDIEGADVASYALYIKGENEGKLTGVQNTEIVSVAATSGEALTSGQWGYIVFDDPSTASKNLTSTAVKQLTGKDVEVTKGQDDSENHSVVDVKKAIAFAANFDKDAPTGHYKSAVTLSLAATPKSLVKGIREGMYMQDITAEMCALTDLNTPITVKDKRDNKDYSIARIKNQTDDETNCWMTSNLAFDIKNKSSQMTTALSDVTTDKTDWASNNVTINLGAYTTGATGNAAAVYTNATPTAGSTASNYRSEYGYYYSWCAATAGSCTDSITDDGSTGKRSASQSICPKGWKLPTGGSGGEYQALLGSSSWSTVNAGTKYNFYPAGSVSSSGAGNIGTNARYWSSTSYSDVNAYYFYYNGSSMRPANYNDRYIGSSVRCVLKNALEAAIADAGITTMQDFTASICAKGNLGDTATLTDARDNKQYNIARIKNATNDTAHCWMTSNLALDLETKWNSTYMTPEYTDVPSDSYFSGIGSATAMNTRFSVSTSNYQAIEYTNASPTVASGHNAYNSTYGYYYTWCAATAGCKRGTATGANLTSGDADASICPAGWKLPSGSANGEWYNLLKDLNMSTIAATPYDIPAAGDMNSNGLNFAGSYGYYWSRTASDTNSAYDLYFHSGSVSPGTSKDNRYFGCSVRCVVEVSSQE